MIDIETSKFSGHCLCGSVKFECSSKPEFPHCCHCDDCRRASGSVHGSFVYVSAKTLRVTGEMHSYQHQNDHGSTMTKYFCPICGSHMVGSNSKKPERRSVWVGVIDSANWFKPAAYFYASKKLPHTPVDPDAKTFDKMPI